MISKDTFQFLSLLAVNNNRPWFEKNRHRYEKARADYAAFIGKIMEGIHKIEVVPEKEPLKYVQRIYRDIRFSKDKTPYKKHMSSILSRGPENLRCHVYIQIQPGNSMIAGGIWDPSPATLKKARQEIDYNGPELRKITGSAEFIKRFGKMSGEKLTRPPKGYEADHPDIEFLRFKQFLAVNKFPDELVLSKNLVSEVLKSYKAALPFLHFFDRALAD